MKYQILAERYAKALFSLAKDENAIEVYGHDLEHLGQVIADTPYFLRAFADQAIAKEKRQKAFAEMQEQLGLQAHVHQFMILLIEKGRVLLLPSAIQAFLKLDEERQGLASAKVTIAESSLAQQTKDHIDEVLKKLLHRKPRCHINVDPKVLGGFIVNVGDIVYDASLKGRLQRMKEKLL
ncbi:MAG: ATP synthase F1 subunit delta [Deltaproteobacteria bacterium]|nr:ATP synthase F1 subunit delta [Deltaproteobacteria bacterium]